MQLRYIVISSVLLLATSPAYATTTTAATRGKGSGIVLQCWPKRALAHGQRRAGRSNKATAASRDLPLGSKAKVTNEKTGQSTDVRITDRGPSRKDRKIDVSRKAADDIGMTSRVQRPSPLNLKVSS